MKKILSYIIIAASMCGVTVGALNCANTPEMPTGTTEAIYASDNTSETKEDKAAELNAETPADMPEEYAENSDGGQNAETQSSVVNTEPAKNSVNTESAREAETESKNQSGGNSANDCQSVGNVSDYVKKAEELVSNKTEVTADEVKDFCDSVNRSSNRDKICSALDFEELRSLLEKFGCSLENNQNTTCPSTESTEPKDKTETTVPNNPGNDSANNSGNQNSKPSENTNSGSVSEYEKKVVELVNEIRVKNGLSKLTLNTELSAVARLKSQDMKDKGYFNHTSPTYGSPYDMMKQFGISYRSAGENIAMGYNTPEAVVNAWMNSEGHRANILSSSFTQIGVGYVANGGYWTQMFIG